MNRESSFAVPYVGRAFDILDALPHQTKASMPADAARVVEEMEPT